MERQPHIQDYHANQLLSFNNGDILQPENHAPPEILPVFVKALHTKRQVPAGKLGQDYHTEVTFRRERRR